MKTIKMKKADWEKWDAALRSGEYMQAREVMHDATAGGYCCLGVLQMALDNYVETDNDEELPSTGWLESHGIRFAHSDGLAVTDDGNPYQQPYLPAIGMPAAHANDKLVDGAAFDDCTHAYDFIAIADAIKDAVEFTDVGCVE